MDVDKEELLEPLNVIKEKCEETCCKDCPLRTDSNECYLESHIPCEWPIKDHEEPWRAFED